MAYVIACLMASLSFLLNKALLKTVGPRSIVSFSPAVEEALKTLPAYYLSADILATHVTFGLLEAVYDWLPKRKSSDKAALFSLIGHTLFGLATIAALWLADSIWMAVAAGFACHLAWNAAVVTFYAPREGSGGQ